MFDINSSIIETIRDLLIDGEESGESNFSIDDIIELEFPRNEDR